MTILLGSCGSDSDSAFDVLGARLGTADYEIGQTLPQLLGDPDSQMTVIQGTVTAVNPGIGMSWTFDDDTEQRHLTIFGEQQAMVHTVHVTITIDRSLTGMSNNPAEVRFGLVIDEPEQFDKLQEGLTGEQFVAFLAKSELWDYEADLYGVMFDGALLCRTDGEDLDCPALEEGLASALELSAASSTLLSQNKPVLRFEDPDLAGLCSDLDADFAEGEPSPATTEEEAASLLIAENSILDGLDVRDGKILHRGQQVGSYQVIERPGGTYSVASAEWCFPSG